MSLTTIRNHSNITSTVKSDKQIIIATATFTDLGMEIKAVSTPSMFDKHELEIIANYYSVIICTKPRDEALWPFSRAPQRQLDFKHVKISNNRQLGER